MASTDYDSSSNEAVGISGFGGHQLSQAVGAFEATAEASPYAPLAEIGVDDAEQLVAIAANPDVREELQFALGLRDAEFQALVESAQSLLPAGRLAEVNHKVTPEFGLGVLAPTPETLASLDSMTEAVTLAAQPVALPAAVNLIPYMSPIRNQQSRGTCVSFTLTALNEYILRRRGIIRDLSEQHLYQETKLIDGFPNDCGTWQVKAVIALLNRGQCRETIWPYNPNPPCNNHGVRPANARPDGLNQRLTTQAVPTRNVQAYKTTLSKQRPVTISVPVYNSWFQSAETRRSGRITMRVGNEPAAGGHAMILVGYQDTPSSPGGGYFIVRNSWGTGWAYQSPYGGGYGTIPYQYIANDCWEAFTAVVPGVFSDEDKEGETPESTGSTVVIEVSPNVKITITTS